MKRTVVYMSNKAMELTNKIVKAEDLDITVTVEDSKLGDTCIVIYGETEEVETFEEIYNMVAQGRY